MAVRWSFQKSKFRKELMRYKKEYEMLQTERLSKYAEEQIQILGNEIIAAGHQDTGNLLDSLCWGVWHNKKKVKVGFYTKEQQATEESYLHELSPMLKQSVNGRQLAQQFLNEYESYLNVDDGWQIVWGVLAPYYVYWEVGHENILIGDYVQFEAMSQRYDHIKDTLEPACRTLFSVVLNAL